MVDDDDEQQALHDAIARAVASDGLLTGWIVIYETQPLDLDRGACGHFYGPTGMTNWRALGLVEWARRYTLVVDDEEPEEPE